MILSKKLVEDFLIKAGYETKMNSDLGIGTEDSEDPNIVSYDEYMEIKDNIKQVQLAIDYTYKYLLRAPKVPAAALKLKKLITSVFKYSMLEIHKPTSLGVSAFDVDDTYYHSGHVFKLDVLTNQEEA